MFTGFARLPDGDVRQLSSLEALAEVWKQAQAVVWADLEEPTEDELRTLGGVIRADDAALEDCLHGEQHPRIDEYDDHFFMVLYGAAGPEPDARFDPRKLAVFCGRRFLVTVHREPLRTIGVLLDRCNRHPNMFPATGVDALLHQIIDMMIDNIVDLADKYDDRLEELEDRSLSPDANESILEDVLDLRRELLELRRIAASQRELLTPVIDGEFDYISEVLAQRFSHVRDHLVKAVEQVDGQRERLTGVRDNYHATLAVRANDAVQTLTVFAAVLLPLSVVAGIYGMNLPVWPPGENPLSFWAVIAVMLAMAGGLMLYFKRRGWW